MQHGKLLANFTGKEQSATPYLVVNGGVQKVFPAETENNMNESKMAEKKRSLKAEASRVVAVLTIISKV